MERAAVVLPRRSNSLPECSISTSTLAFDRHFVTTAKGILLLAEIVCGMLVWILLGGTEYFNLSALCWVMFVAILCWLLTICLFILYLTGAHNRISQIPWTTLSLCVNCSATALYLVAAVLDALSVNHAIRGRHNYNCWAASAAHRCPGGIPRLNPTSQKRLLSHKMPKNDLLVLTTTEHPHTGGPYISPGVRFYILGDVQFRCFAFLTTLCYAGSSYLSYRAWKATKEDH